MAYLESSLPAGVWPRAVMNDDDVGCLHDHLAGGQDPICVVHVLRASKLRAGAEQWIESNMPAAPEAQRHAGAHSAHPQCTQLPAKTPMALHLLGGDEHGGWIVLGGGQGSEDDARFGLAEERLVDTGEPIWGCGAVVVDEREHITRAAFDGEVARNRGVLLIESQVDNPRDQDRPCRRKEPRFIAVALIDEQKFPARIANPRETVQQVRNIVC